MPRSKEAYEVALRITEALRETGVLRLVDDYTQEKTRGIIQIILEDNYYLIAIPRAV